MGASLDAQAVTLESMTKYKPGNLPNVDYIKDINGLFNNLL